MLHILLYPLIGVPTLLLLVLIHELGHWTVAKALRMRTPYFVLGLGPTLISRTSRRMRTEFRLCLFPVAGFVEVPALEAKPKVWDRTRPWKAALVLLAGPVANLALGSLLIDALGERIMPPIFYRHPAKALHAYVPRIAHVIVHTYTSPSEFQGPVSIARDAASIGIRKGFHEWLLFVACASLGMGLFNLTPLFPFDGGQLFWLFVRRLPWVGRTAWIETAEWVQAIVVLGGFLALIVFDALRIFQPMLLVVR